MKKQKQNIRQAFDAIQASTLFYARRIVEGEPPSILYFCTNKSGTLCITMSHKIEDKTILGEPMQYANKIGNESFTLDQVLSDYYIFTAEEIISGEEVG